MSSPYQFSVNHPLGKKDNLVSFRAWLAKHLKSSKITLTPLLKEASARTYYRVNHHPCSFVAVDSPSSQTDIPALIKLTDFFSHRGINVPAIHACDQTQGFLLITDFGDQLLLDRLNESSAPQLYAQAMDILVKIHNSYDSNNPMFACYREDDWQRESSWFISWYVKHYLNFPMRSHHADTWSNLVKIILQNVMQQPRVLIHKDFHCRNLMYLNNQTLGVIDYQDAIVGPITYDIASLLNDCYIDWPRTQVEDWLLAFKDKLQHANLLTTISNQQFVRWFDITCLQRHLKNLGNFVRLNHENNMPQFLNYLPRMYGYITDITLRHPDLAEFAKWFEQLTKIEQVQ